MVMLTASTAALLAIQLDTPVWVIAALLGGRGLAVGLAIQPLLFALTVGLEPAKIADTNTLFNVSQRLGGAVGIALLTTFFQLRVLGYVAQVLQPFGLDPSSLGQGAGGSRAGVAVLPQAVQAQVAQAALGGFQDTITLLVILSLVGCVAALLLPRRAAGHMGASTGTSASLVAQ